MKTTKKINFKGRTNYPELKFVIAKRCSKCGKIVLLDKMYLCNNDSCNWNFCTGCVHSLDEAIVASIVDSPKKKFQLS